MRVLVTGTTGFVGSHAVKELLAQGFDVRVLARTPSKVPTVLAARLRGRRRRARGHDGPGERTSRPDRLRRSPVDWLRAEGHV